MQSDEQRVNRNDEPPHTRRKLEFFYYEQVGSRYYLRFTLLTLFLIVGLTVLSLAMLLVFFFLSDHSSHLKEVNVNVTAPKSSPYPLSPIITRPTPQPSPPKANKLPSDSVTKPSPLTLPRTNETRNIAPANSAETQTSRNNNGQ